MNPLSILLVDDEEGMRLGMERALKNYTVEVPQFEDSVTFTLDMAATGEEALEKIEASPPHIILLDNKLPGMNGIEVMETISEKNIDSMIIMISAYASIETAVKATKTGAFDFLPKPFTPEELKNTIRKAARHKITQLQAQKLAEEKRQVRFQFISVLSHELKAPLNAVEGYLKIVKDKSAGDDPAVYEHMIERCLTRMEYMRKLIFDLLDLTRIESGQKTRNLEQIDLLKPVKTAIENALPSAEERGISINLHTDSEEILFWADEGELEIMMNNLVSNAVKYNKDNGTVDITVKPNQDNVTISVADTGIGLSPDEKEKLFEDFVRIKNKKTKNILGSGLGLSTVKKLVKLYDGSIDVESEPDKGSTFTIVLYEKKPE
jgi:signal transduction histidine kinase